MVREKDKSRCKGKESTGYDVTVMTKLIEILGGGCQKCDALTKSAEEVVKKLEWTDVKIIHITDMDEIVNRGVFSTPALSLNGEIIVSGKYLPPNKLEKLLTRHQTK